MQEGNEVIGFLQYVLLVNSVARTVAGTESFVKMNLIKPGTIEHRDYQVNLAESATKESTMVVLSTGLGKTIIAALLTAKRLAKYSNSKVLFLAPSRPLANQHTRFMKQVLAISSDSIVCMTGDDAPSERPSIWKRSKVIVMTPQALQNDLVQNSYDLSNVSLIVYDEAHRGVGNYAYTFVAELYEKQAKYPLGLGLTASPGHNPEHIRQVCENLNLTQIEVRNETSPDVKDYVVSVDTDIRYVRLPAEIEVLRDILYDLLDDYARPIKKYGYSLSDSRRMSRSEILEVQRKVRREIGSYTNPPRHLFLIMRNLTSAIRIVQLLEFVGTQGLTPTFRYVQNMYEEVRNRKSSKGLQDLISRPEFDQFRNLLEALIAKGYRHPKADALLEIISEQLSVDEDSRILVFTRYRDTAAEVVDTIQQLDEVRASKFVGQSSRGSDKGFTQKKQLEVLEGFRSNEFNVLVATQVGEEGLDIPECNLVIFYDCVPSIVPYIQRKGRTGRKYPGQVIIFVAKGTHDEFYHWSVKKKLKKMPSALEEAEDDSQTSLEDFANKREPTPKEKPSSPPTRTKDGKIKMIVDSRELPTAVARELARLNVVISGESLEIGDYIASEDVAVERKEANDFIESMIDGRLFSQLIELKSTYRRPALIIEGEQIIGLRAVNPASIYGALASIAIRIGVPIIWTRNEEETANVLYRIAYLEQEKEKKPIRTRPSESKSRDADVLEYILSGFPGIDTVISRAILTKFGTLEKVFKADKKELQSVNGVGPKKAGRIRRLLRTIHPFYEGEEKEDDAE